MENRSHIRNCVIILGDQLTERLSAFDGFDRDRDIVWMAEVAHESQKVWSSKQRIVLFLAAMRHFAQGLKTKGIRVHYHRLDDRQPAVTLSQALAGFLNDHSPERVILTQPGEYEVLEEFKRFCNDHPAQLEIREDREFLCSIEGFKEHARNRKQLRMEYFYREMRRKHSVLMDGKKPIGGNWNFDSSNRKSFGKSGPAAPARRHRFPPDEIAREVIDLVNSRFPDHPGNVDNFLWPVNREQALSFLKDFIENHLPSFGAHQDAMWTDEPYLNHSLLASSLNLKLLHPREVIEAAEKAYSDKQAPIESVEGFIRQILGWREYVRGVYWTQMPGYVKMNHLDADLPLPSFYWTGDTEMHCIRQVVEQTFQHGYAHHIQRLMVTGLYGLLSGINPEELHKWYLAAYVDAVEWVEMPNTMGMSQYADGGIMASKPYAATGKYINRMSNYCDGCRFDPNKRTGDDACPFTVMYWEFLYRNKTKLESIQRMVMQLRNLENINPDELVEICNQADKIRSNYHMPED